MTIDDLPALNASLNGAAFLVLLLGRRFIRRKRVAAHRACMLTAVGLSTLFLASYLTYHFSRHLMTPFEGEGAWRLLYFSILFTHIPLAAVLLPVVGVALYHALRRNFPKHKRVVRWAYPLWLYVSATGVAVYWMLYRVEW